MFKTLSSLLHSVSIRGADNVGEVSLEVAPGKPVDYYWAGHGLRLHIPVNALETNTPPLTMKIQASLSGQFELPDDMELVSGVYWISFPSKSLVQPVTLELQHCARLEQNEQTRLTFVTSKCNQETLPYNFKPLDGGGFSSKSDYGIVQIKHFSGIAVASGTESVSKKYLALTYYQQARPPRTTWEMHFTIISNLELRLEVCLLGIWQFICSSVYEVPFFFLQEMEKYYPKEEAELTLRLPFVFEGDKVTLEIPVTGIELPNGWSIVPMAHPTSVSFTSVLINCTLVISTFHLLVNDLFCHFCTKVQKIASM